MTPKEKAQELTILCGNVKNAIICVDQIIDAYPIRYKKTTAMFQQSIGDKLQDSIDWWNEVRDELEKM